MIKKLASRLVYKNDWMRVREDDVRFPDGKEGIYGVVEKEAAALIIPKLANTFILVNLYRHTIGQSVWEFPHGAVEGQNLSGEEVARRELEEETGYRAKDCTKIASLHVAYGYSNQVVHVFIAEELSKGELRRESGEIGMKTDEFSAQEIDDMIARGEITDTQSIAAWALYGMPRHSSE